MVCNEDVFNAERDRLLIETVYYFNQRTTLVFDPIQNDICIC